MRRPGTATDIEAQLAGLEPAAAVRLLTGADFWALHDDPALGLRRIVTSDGPAGVRGELWDERDPSLNPPCPTALAASFDPALVGEIGELLAAECRRKGVDVLLGPTVNIQRTPVAGRHFECFSEDPLLSARLAVAYIRGVQRHGVAATVKHVVANDFERRRFTADVAVDARTLREVYLAPFEAAVREAGVWAAMAAYNSVGGTTMTENPLLGVLRHEWGFDGVIMSDWFAARSLAAAPAELDLAMPGPSGPWGAELVEAMASGAVAVEPVAAKLQRLLLLARRVGALASDDAPAAEPRPAHRAAPALTARAAVDAAALLRRAAAAGTVLLRNEPVPAPDGPPVAVLPLPTDRPITVALIGEHATAPRILGGGSAFVFPTAVSTPAAALGAALSTGRATLRVVPGVAVSDRIGVPTPDSLWTGVEPGVTVTFHGAAPDGIPGVGPVLGAEHRRATTFNWNNHFTDGVRPGDVRAVQVRATYRATTGGEHVFGCSGTGRHRLRIDGTEVLDAHLVLPPGADGVEGLTRPPQAGHVRHLDAGEEVELVLRRDVDEPAEEGGVTIVALQLNVSGPRPDDDRVLLDAERVAADADVAVVVVGTTEESEGEGFDRDDLHLTGRQDELVRRVAAANPRTVVVVNAGAPVLLPWRAEVAAVLVAWLPGQEFGAALADVLLGVTEPGGRLPMTWPADAGDPVPGTDGVDGVVVYTEGLHVGHRRYLRDAVEPAYWFGHGLGYTTWAYEELAVAPAADGAVRVTVGLRNTGRRAGREVVQVYLARPGSALDRPRRWLAGFAAVSAEPGESVTVDVEVAPRAFAHWVAQDRGPVPGLVGHWAQEEGAFTVLVGPHAGAPVLRGEVHRPHD